MKKKRLYLIDGMSHLYRSFFAIRRLSNSKGFPTNAIYGFTMMLRKIIKDDKPDYLAVCFDTPERTFRHDGYEAYKANRALMPDDLSPQVEYVQHVCDAFNVPLVKAPGFEADDVIGTLAVKAVAAHMQAVIVSNDKDMGQLVNDDICIMKWDKTGYILCDDKAVKAWLGVWPHQVVDLLGLMGDSSDNVPGAPGIGEKGAIQLIEQFGSIEGALANWEQVTRKTYRESLRDHAEQIRLSRRLVTIHTDIPIALDLEALKCREANRAKAYELFTELEFSALVNEFAPAAGEAPVAVKAVAAQPLQLSYRSVNDVNDLKRVTDAMWANDGFAFACKAGEKDEAHMLTGLSFSPAIGSADRIDLATLDTARVLEPLRDIWTNGFIAKTVHDSKQALTLLNNAYRQVSRESGGARPPDLHFEGLADDTLLAAYLLNPDQLRYGLPELAQEYLGIEIVAAAEMDAADITLRLAPVLRQRLAAEGMENLYLNFELPLVDILYDMEQVGVAIDTGALSELSVQFDEMLGKLQQEIYKLAGQEFNINSPMQLGEIFEKLNFHLSRKTKTGRISTSADVLEELADKYELPRKILDYRELAKLKSTYIDALPRLINSDTGRVHTTFNQTVAGTGRLSSTNPNLQNIPVRSDSGRQIRRAFVPAPGYVLLSADYSQIELRLLAHITGDPIMTRAFQNGEDIHTTTAREVFGAKTDAELRAARRLAKTTNFGIAYGVGAFGLAQRVGISRTEAKEAIDNYYNTYTGVRTYMEELPEQSRQDGIVRTLFGRIRRLPDLNNQNRNLRARAEREAINAPIQGTAADLVKLAMIKVVRRLKNEKLQARLLLQVHDELLLEVPPHELDKVKALVKTEMENVYKLDVPLEVEVRAGNNWLELK